MSHPTMSHADLLEAAEKLVPLVREKARDAEIARRASDEVIDAVRASGLYSMMVPREYGGHEADLDTFFEATLTLSRADASTGWLTAFYIEHNYPNGRCRCPRTTGSSEDAAAREGIAR